MAVRLRNNPDNIGELGGASRLERVFWQGNHRDPDENRFLRVVSGSPREWLTSDSTPFWDISAYEDWSNERNPLVFAFLKEGVFKGIVHYSRSPSEAAIDTGVLATRRSHESGLVTGMLALAHFHAVEETPAALSHSVLGDYRAAYELHPASESMVPLSDVMVVKPVSVGAAVDAA